MANVLAVIALLSLTLGHSSASAQPRPDTPDAELLFTFEPGELVETFSAGPITAHFTRAGSNAVPNTDADDNGVPDFVEEVASQYVEALAFYESEGFAAPLADSAGGDAGLDVYLLDLFGSADGSYQRDDCDTSGCRGYMVHENDFVGYGYPSLRVANRIVASHELFHAIQAAYAPTLGSVFSEGTATWATERFDGSLRDFDSAIGGYLADPERPLDSDVAGAVLDRFAYGSALFFRFLEERFGAHVVHSLVEAHGGDASFLVPLESVLAAEGTSFAEAWVEHVRWNLWAGSDGDGDGYAEGPSYPRVTPREVSLPLVEERPRHFHAAARYYRVDAGSRETIVAELPGELEGLVLFAGLEREGEQRTVDAVEGRLELVDAAGATVWLVVVNPALEGPSARASICAGDAAEVATCRDALSPPELVDAGVPADASVPTDDPSGGGCGAAGGPPSGAWFAIGWGLVATRRRARR